MLNRKQVGCLCLLLLFRQRIVLEVDFHTGRTGLRIGKHGNQRLLVVGNVINNSLCRVNRLGNVGKNTLNAALHRFGVYIANHHNGLQIGSIPFFIVGTQRFVSKVVNDSRIANHITFGILRTGKHLLHGGSPKTPTGCLARAPLFADYPPLLVDLFSIQGDKARPIVQNKESTVDN